MTAPYRCAVGLSNLGPYADPRLVVAIARDAETAGWDGLFLWDHVLHRDPAQAVGDPWIALAAVAASTSRLWLGPMVVALPRRRPWKVAREIAALDVLSEGRTIIGFGSGSVPAEFSAFGEDPALAVRAAKLDEGLAVVTQALGGEPLRFDGRHYVVDAAPFLPRPVQRPRPRLWLGGRWPHRAPFVRAARYDGIIPVHEGYAFAAGEAMPPDELATIVEFVRAQRTDPSPFDVAYGGPTDGTDRAGEARRLAAYAEAGLTWWLEPVGPWRGSVEAMVDRVRQGPPS